MSSMADRYRTANANMSYVEFQRVATSRGIFRAGKSRISRTRNHSGKRSVVECIIAKDILRSYSGIWVSSKTAISKVY